MADEEFNQSELEAKLNEAETKLALAQANLIVLEASLINGLRVFIDWLDNNRELELIKTSDATPPLKAKHILAFMYLAKEFRNAVRKPTKRILKCMP